MRPDTIRRYVWLIDQLQKYGRLTRRQISDMWERASIGDGHPLPERTFHHHRRAVEENFHIEMKCDAAGRYYIAEAGNPQEEAFRQWLLNSYAVSDALSDSPASANYILVEEVPSSREFLPLVLEALKRGKCIRFSYAGFSRSRTETGIGFSPAFVRLYKQRWYMVGEKLDSGQLRTYALDRVKEMQLTDAPARCRDDIDPRTFFQDCLGVTVPKSKPKSVRLRVDPIQAKYLRALPLHHTQQEISTASDHSVFSYTLKLNYELVHEILALGPQATVLSPPELRLMITEELHRTLANYNRKGAPDAAPRRRNIL